MTKLILFSGQPGAGKTTLARRLAELIGALYLRIDSIEAALDGIDRTEGRPGGYLSAMAVARDNLALSRTTIADAVNPDDWSRSRWAAIADQTGAILCPVMVICTDPAIHSARVEARRPDTPGETIPDWTRAATRTVAPWDRPCITVNTAHLDPDIAARMILPGIESLPQVLARFDPSA